jgi:Fe2+ or Zn2+ uptake regulation protein
LFAPIDTRLRKEMGFTVSEHGIVLKGICANCSATASR